jgi:hypothetical protein
MIWEDLAIGISSSIIGTLIFNLIFQNINKKSKERIKLNLPKDLFLICLSITIFFGILSLFGFYYEWEKFVYLTIITFVFGALSFFIKEKQCPKCKKVFDNKRVHTEVLKTEKRPYRYRDLTIYYYSDNTEKNRKYHGRQKKIMETIETRRDYFECACGHKWNNSPYKVNLDSKNRPKPDKVKTNIRNPNEFSI